MCRAYLKFIAISLFFLVIKNESMANPPLLLTDQSTENYEAAFRKRSEDRYLENIIDALHGYDELQTIENRLARATYIKRYANEKNRTNPFFRSISIDIAHSISSYLKPKERERLKYTSQDLKELVTQSQKIDHFFRLKKALLESDSLEIQSLVKELNHHLNNEILDAYLGALNHPKLDIKVFIASQLSQIPNVYSKYQDQILSVLAEGINKETWASPDANRALEKLRPHGLEILRRRLITLLDSDNPSDLNVARTTLNRYLHRENEVFSPAEIIEFFGRIVDTSQNIQVRKSSVHGLTKLNLNDAHLNAAILRVLNRAVRDVDPVVRDIAVFGILKLEKTQLNRNAGLEVLNSTLSHCAIHAVDQLMPLLINNDWDILATFLARLIDSPLAQLKVAILSNLLSTDFNPEELGVREQIFQTATAILDNEDQQVRLLAFDCMIKFSSDRRSVLNILASRFELDRNLRNRAASTLTLYASQSDEEALNILFNFLNHRSDENLETDEEIRDLASNSLSDLASERPDLRPRILQALKANLQDTSAYVHEETSRVIPKLEGRN